MNSSWQNRLGQLPVETVRDCLLCEGEHGVPDRRWYEYLDLMPPFDVVRCPVCSLRWLSPRPNAEGYATLYTDAMYFGGAGASPADYESATKARLDYMRARISRIERMSNKEGPLSILDYGAATGDFVRAGRDAGNDCIGIELSADARAVAEQKNGVTLLSIDAVEEMFGPRFDAIHMNHVLEHMPDPLAHARWCAQVLKPGGLFVLEVPQQFDNDLDRLRRGLRVGGKQSRFDAYSLHHTYFFTPSTMEALLVKAGFKVQSLATFNKAKTPLWPLSPKNYVLRPLLGMADRLHAGGNIIEVFARRVD
ncbi:MULTISPECIES: class I SAM-dependent methyltransferase [unclassified Dyella]|uniref:class I SAM-dependent methyltransferase n=1 Tax=unclassified Dyella TaxID=2634549 RepID=UPI0013042CF5|nr:MULTISPECIES: class I SAM-dependent methyltransferase [unclassified Dyella]MDR3444770.1 class I SAM-dependent methyltransferase [Dyella sp.]